MQARATAPAILLLRRLERIFPAQPNVSVVRRFADTLTAASSTLGRPYIPEFQPLPDAETLAERDPEEPLPINDLPWAALHARHTPAVRPDGSLAKPPQGFTAARLDALFGRYPPGVVLIAATTSKPADIPVALRRVFTVELSVPALPEEQRERALARVLGDASGLDADDLRTAAQSTAGFLPCDLGAMACDAVLTVLLDKLSGDRASDDDVVRARTLPCNMHLRHAPAPRTCITHMHRAHASRTCIAHMTTRCTRAPPCVTHLHHAPAAPSLCTAVCLKDPAEPRLQVTV